jgi:HK97 family phage prohead protease
MFATAERRYLTKPSHPLEVRAGPSGKGQITGYASVFNSLSEDLGGFVEIVRPGAFRRYLNGGGEVVCLLNHDPNHILGRRSSGTLEVDEDPIGLRFTVQVNPADPLALGTLAAVERRDLIQASFGFDLMVSTWEKTSGGMDLRIIEEVKRLYDVSPVCFPAYPETEVVARAALRSLAAERSLPMEALEVALRQHRLREYLATPDPAAPSALAELEIARRRHALVAAQEPAGKPPPPAAPVMRVLGLSSGGY